MSPRTGRPPKENPKDTRIQIRLDKETLDKLDECAEREQTSRSEIIRRGIDLVCAKQKNKR
ncbi:MAG: ribbon-helix-helix protein, CopG family [Oscillospiraceae bacterium]|nr:ribbon-helix-helix protein, CopG family [Oscillospiraceae bacterium]